MTELCLKFNSVAGHLWSVGGCWPPKIQIQMPIILEVVRVGCKGEKKPLKEAPEKDPAELLSILCPTPYNKK